MLPFGDVALLPFGVDCLLLLGVYILLLFGGDGCDDGGLWACGLVTDALATLTGPTGFVPLLPSVCPCPRLPFADGVKLLLPLLRVGDEGPPGSRLIGVCWGPCSWADWAFFPSPVGTYKLPSCEGGEVTALISVLVVEEKRSAKRRLTASSLPPG